MAARSTGWVCGRSFAGMWVLIAPRAGRLSVVSDVYCQVEDSATDGSLVQRCPSECGVSAECDSEA